VDEDPASHCWPLVGEIGYSPRAQTLALGRRTSDPTPITRSNAAREVTVSRCRRIASLVISGFADTIKY
jgi:hypothetical protein